MPSYDYACPGCGTVTEIFCPISSRPEHPPCLTCGTPTERLFNQVQIIGDEFKSGIAVGADGIPRKVHGDHFCVGLGEHVESKSHARRLAAAQGVTCTGEDPAILKHRTIPRFRVPASANNPLKIAKIAQEIRDARLARESATKSAIVL